MTPEQLEDQERVQGDVNGIIVALTDPMYRKSTWVCLLLSLLNIMTGVHVLTMFIEQMFDEVLANNIHHDKKILT